MESLKILVVDDESRMRKLVKEVFVRRKDLLLLRPETARKRWTSSLK